MGWVGRGPPPSSQIVPRCRLGEGRSETPHIIQIEIWIVSAAWAACVALAVAGAFVGVYADAVHGDGKSVLCRELEDLSLGTRLHRRNRYGR